MVRTDADGEGDEAEAGQGVLEEIWTARAQEGGAGTVVLAVVGGVEAGSMSVREWIEWSG